MQPTPKSERVEHVLQLLAGDSRIDAITQDRCLKAPIGCGQPIGPFRSAQHEHDYTITAICQACQDRLAVELAEMEA